MPRPLVVGPERHDRPAREDESDHVQDGWDARACAFLHPHAVVGGGEAASAVLDRPAGGEPAARFEDVEPADIVLVFQAQAQGLAVALGRRRAACLPQPILDEFRRHDLAEHLGREIAHRR